MLQLCASESVPVARGCGSALALGHYTMQTQSSKASYWLIGKTRRERAASFLAFVAVGLGFLWGMVNDMTYGYEGAVPSYRLNTNGRFDVSIVLGVFFSCITASVFFVLLFWCFRFFDRKHHDVA